MFVAIQLWEECDRLGTQTNEKDRHPILRNSLPSSSVRALSIRVWRKERLHLDSATADVNRNLTRVPVEFLPPFPAETEEN
jgi:hypothetical protein